MNQLRGRNALLTGAAGGLAGYIANSLAAEGVNLVLSDLPEASLDERVADLRKRGITVESVPANLADRTEAEGLIAKAEEALGPLDILVNNAGVEFPGPFVDKSLAELEMLIQVNLTALLLTTRQALPGMLERGGGHVVNIASMAGKATFPQLVPYCASKHGVVGFTHSLRSEYGDEPVGFSAICPGIIGKVGMFGRYEEHAGKPPAGVGVLPPERVGEAVVKAICENKAEVIVNPPGAKLAIALAALAPKTYARIGRQRRVREFSERYMAARAKVEPTHAEKRVAQRD